ncbi:MAG TPA: GNAT family N-acetyltransferase [Burkholderiaceae bacterium]|nr:GNAT family N-acetyltransferase [Burkholderiaceae bacterium]
MRTLQTARLTLEPQCAAHAAAMFAVLSDPAIYEYENAPPASVDALRARYAFLEGRRSPDGSQQWLNWVARLRPAESRVARLRPAEPRVARLRPEESRVVRLRPEESELAPLPPGEEPMGALIGYVQATVHADHRAAVAYEFASAFWHRGLASEAVQAMIDELVAAHEVERLSAVLKARNQRSRRLLERLGFTPAAAAERAAAQVDADELLMLRSAVRDG